EALVALQTEELSAEELGDGLAELGLAHAGGALGEDGLFQAVGEKHRRRQGAVGDVADARQARGDVVDGAERGLSHGPGPRRSAEAPRTVRRRSIRVHSRKPRRNWSWCRSWPPG